MLCRESLLRKRATSQRADNVVADLESPHIFADGADDARGFIARHERCRRAHLVFAGDIENVCEVQACGPHIDDDLVGAG